jgi:hypothetical protein
MGQTFCGELGSLDIDDPAAEKVDYEDERNENEEEKARRPIVTDEEAETALAKTSLRTPSLTEADKDVLRATWRVLDLDRTAVGTQFVLQ